jgi:hypothetical protein
MSNHLNARQNALRSPVSEIEERLDAVASAFGIAWLKERGDNPVQKLWNRTDYLATNELVWLGDAILKMQSVDRKWTAKELSKVKNDTANNRKGAVFEIIGLSIFTERLRVVPSAGGNPGYDGTIHFPGSGRLALSLKNYGASTHERAVQNHGAELEASFRASLESLSLNGLDLRIIAKQYPSDADWARLESNLSEIIRTNPEIEGHCAQDGVWAVFLRPMNGYEPRTAPRLSYQVTILIPLHANERQNLISKLDVAYANAQKHASSEDDLCRGIMLRLPENASMVSCQNWAQEYFRDRPKWAGRSHLILPTVGRSPARQSNRDWACHGHCTWTTISRMVSSAWRPRSAPRWGFLRGRHDAKSSRVGAAGE